MKNAVGVGILGAGLLGYALLGSKGSSDASVFGAGSGGYSIGGDPNFTAITKDPINTITSSEPSSTPSFSFSDLFGAPTQTTPETTTNGGGGSTKKSTFYAPASTSFGVGYFDTSGKMVGGEDNIAMMSFIGDTAPSQNPLFKNAGTKKSSSSIPAGAIGQNIDGSYIYASGGSSKAPSSPSSSGGSTKKSLKTDRLSGRDKGKGSYIVKKSDGSKVKRFFQ